MKFFYKNYYGTLRPVVSILVSNPDSEVEVDCQVLVDSGAEVCILPYEIGKRLGLSPSEERKETEYLGIGGKEVECMVHTVHFRIGGWSHSAAVRFLSRKDDRKVPYGIVGQRGFFQFFKVSFDRHKEEIEIRK